MQLQKIIRNEFPLFGASGTLASSSHVEYSTAINGFYIVTKASLDSLCYNMSIDFGPS